MTPDQEKADSLLFDHYHWQSSWRPKIGYGNSAPECRGATTSRQWDSTSDIVEETTSKAEMESVDWCLDHIKLESRIAIEKEMRVRTYAHKLLSESYIFALNEIMPYMRKRNLI